VADPEMLILDEPMSGLDPVGRKQVRDLILEERDAGRTIFFATHILSDVESLCDHVIILKEGEVAVADSLDVLLRAERVDITIADASDELLAHFDDEGLTVRRASGTVQVVVTGQRAVTDNLRKTFELGGVVVSVQPHGDTLEELFMRRAL